MFMHKTIALILNMEVNNIKDNTRSIILIFINSIISNLELKFLNLTF